jgi:gamma-glutamylcyclotransferase (GGCT)/AIG2-like uncharacterized protein YtfP
MTRVFVYGTLKRGGENHHWIEAQRSVGPARTRPVYRMFDLGGYPGLVRHPQGVSIEGELWDVDPAGLARLDVLEDVAGGEYERVPGLRDLLVRAQPQKRQLRPVLRIFVIYPTGLKGPWECSPGS